MKKRNVLMAFVIGLSVSCAVVYFPISNQAMGQTPIGAEITEMVIAHLQQTADFTKRLLESTEVTERQKAAIRRGVRPQALGIWKALPELRNTPFPSDPVEALQASVGALRIYLPPQPHKVQVVLAGIIWQRIHRIWLIWRIVY